MDANPEDRAIAAVAVALAQADPARRRTGDIAVAACGLLNATAGPAMARRLVRSTVIVALVSATAPAGVAAQAPPLVFTVAAPPAPVSSAVDVHASAIVAERGLALWRGAASDFGLGVDLIGARWTIHSIASMNVLPIDHHPRPTFAQVEVVRPLVFGGSTSVAAGGGVREQWDGTQVVVGRVLAGTAAGGGRLQGSFVLERAISSAARRDAADIVTSVGWSRRVGARLALGVEGIGQDLEGFWDAAEADGGARLLVGPSIHLRARRGAWSASATAGRVLRGPSVLPPAALATPSTGGRHFGLFASATWLPPPR
jgi:hypothetical protein